MRRAQAAWKHWYDLWAEAEAAATAKFGERRPREGWSDTPRERFRNEHPAMLAWRLTPTTMTDLASWRATVLKDRSLIFHDRMQPARVWAVAVTRDGVVWEEAEIVAITTERVSVVYRGVRCPLHRPLGIFGSRWRGVRFVDERDGWTAAQLEQQWQEKFGHFFPARMELSVARAMLGLPESYTREDVLAAYCKAALRCHPDQGGTAEQFRALVEARDRLLAAIGTSAPKPKMPDFTPRAPHCLPRGAQPCPPHRWRP
jgi:hypothetical protein